MHILATGGAESGAVGADAGHDDPELQSINKAWPVLPDLVGRAVLALVKSSAHSTISPSADG